MPDSPYTKVALDQVADAAASMGVEGMEVRFARGDLEAVDTGLAYHRMGPGVRQPFGHRHGEAEELYVVLEGSGTARVDDDEVALAPRDALRVATTALRAFEAGPEGLAFLAVGPHHEGDGEMVDGWWGGPAESAQG